jgi:hypothetical protein
MLNFRRRTPENSYNSESNEVCGDNNNDNDNDNDNKGNNNSKGVVVRRECASSLPRFVVHISRKNKLQRLIIILITSSTCLLVLYPPVRLRFFNLFCRSITLYLQNCCNSEEEVALWRGTILKEKIPPLEISLKIDLVVSHCDLSIDWIFEWAAPLEFRNITIFSKCDIAVIGAPANSKIIRIGNVGRCDHTYAYYMANYYHESSSNSDYVLFLKDNNNEHRNHYTRHKKLNEMITLSNEFGFACHEEINWVFPDIKRSTRDWWLGGLLHPITQISYYHDWNQLQKFKVKEYSRLGRDDNSQFISQYGNNLGDYAKKMLIEPSSETTSSSSSSETTRIIVPVCYGGNFLFRRKDNLSRSRDFWERIESSLSRGNNIAEGHFMER